MRRLVSVVLHVNLYGKLHAPSRDRARPERQSDLGQSLDGILEVSEITIASIKIQLAHSAFSGKITTVGFHYFAKLEKRILWTREYYGREI